MEGSALSLPWQVVHPGIDGATPPICDEFSREVVALKVERRMESKNVIRILDEAASTGGCWQFVTLAVREWIAQRSPATALFPSNT